MVNKQKLFNALWEEFDAKSKTKAAQRKLARARVRDFNKIADQPRKEEEKQQREQLKTRKKDSKMRQQHLRQQEKKLSHEAKIKNRTEGKPAIMKLLEELYNDEEKGFGSKKELYEQAKEKNPLVTMETVNEFFRKEGSTQAPVEDYKGHKSWVGNLPREQSQVDIGYISKGITEEIANGQEGHFFVCIDVFSKQAEVVVLSSTKAEEALRATKVCIDKMGFPKQLYMDGGSEFKGVFAQFCRQEQIELITTKSYARFAERFIRWVKMQLYKRKRIPGGWAKQVPNLVSKWNSSSHGSTKMNSTEAHKDENALDVKLSLIMDSKHNRKYPELKRGDQVRIKRKNVKFI
jgi:hypothetical protein